MVVAEPRLESLPCARPIVSGRAATLTKPTGTAVSTNWAVHALLQLK